MLVLLAYGSCLDNHFWEIDDQRHVANGAGYPFPNDYFRPGHEWSFRLLWKVAGTDPFPYYASGLLFHWLSSCLVFLLGIRLLGGYAQGLVAGLVFASLFAPHQAIFWVGAQLGVQQVAFALAALLCWLRFLERGGLLLWTAAFFFACMAVCFKECGLNLLPWMLVVHVGIRGFRDLFSPKRILAWLPFILLGGLVAYRALTVPGGVGMEAQWPGPVSLAGRLMRSIGHLPLPLEFERWRYPVGLHWIGLGVFVLPLVGAWLVRILDHGKKGSRGSGIAAVLMAAGLLIGGHTANLTGEPEIIGERFYYDAAPGFALLFAAFFFQASRILSLWRGMRWIAPVLLVAWIGMNVHALLSIEQRKYDQVSRSVERLVKATRKVMNDTLPDKTVLFLSPPLPDIEDFQRILNVWLDIPESRTPIQPWFLPDDERFRKRLAKERMENPFRWSEYKKAWVPFNPGGNAWLDDWKPKYWPGGLKDPNLGKEIRYIAVLPKMVSEE